MQLWQKQLVLPHNPKAYGAPTGHTLKIQDIKPNTGAGFHVAICGDIMRMPGLPKIPAAN